MAYMPISHAHPAMQASSNTFGTTSPEPHSPTLTNPDMILPYGESPSSQRTVRPTANGNGHSSALRSNGLGPRSTRPEPQAGLASTIMMHYRMKPTTSVGPTPGPYEHGIPLSDIGEEDSNASPTSRKTRSSPSSPDLSASSLMVPSEAEKRLKRLSQKSDASSYGSDIGHWEDFDTPKIKSERLKADLAAASDYGDTDLEGVKSKRNSLNINGDDEASSAALSKRAEQILADAKKRLITMEDNLSKARTSVLVSPKASPISGEHMQVGSLYRSISMGSDRRLGQSGHLRKSKPLYQIVKTAQPGHFRGLSETTPFTDASKSPRTTEPRSASALENRPNHPANSIFYRSSQLAENRDLPGSIRSLHSPLRALREEDGSPSSANQTTPLNKAPRGLGITAAEESQLTTELGTDPEHPRPLSQLSQASMYSTRELRDQMNGLRSKIANLRKEAQAENLKRRSLQNLRTSSPFTDAPEQWYAGAAEYKDGESPLSTNAGLGWSPKTDIGPPPLRPARPPESPKDSAFEEVVVHIDTPQSRRITTNANTPLNDNIIPVTSDVSGGNAREREHPDAAVADDVSLEPEEDITTSEEEQIYLNEALEESLHDVQPENTSDNDVNLLLEGEEAERHEDRVDAFDYENMFLHSALGNYTVNGRPLSYASIASQESFDSVETTKATNSNQLVESSETRSGSSSTLKNMQNDATGGRDAISEAPLRPPKPPWMHPSRSYSMDSTATTASFATATEGEVEGTMASEIMDWGERSAENQSSTPSTASSPPTPTQAWPQRGKSLRAELGQTINSRHAQQATTGGLPTPPSVSPINHADQITSRNQPRAGTGNAEMLMASLISLAGPTFQYPTPGGPAITQRFTNVDKDLVIGLLKSAGAVCSNILASDIKQEVYESRVWRRRLDAARRVLDGEIAVEEE